MIAENVSLEAYNGMGVVAHARYFTYFTQISVLKNACDFAQKKCVPILPLGSGSNVLFRQDYPGIALVNQYKGKVVLQETDDDIVVRVNSGELWHDWVTLATESGWYGLENLAYIPGSVGAAPVQNIGAYGVDISHCITQVGFYHFASKKTQCLNLRECEFAYRDSVFKRALRGKGCIIWVDFALSKKTRVNINYPQLQKALVGVSNPTPKKVFDTVVEMRQKKLPNPTCIPNLGSFFKNPIVSKNTLIRLQNSFPRMVFFPLNDGYKLAAGWLIENAGWKKRKINNVQVHTEQALVITNILKKSGEDVYAFALAIQQDIMQKYQVYLEIEPHII